MNKTKTICKNALVAAAYVAMCTLNPISFGALQFRIANLLIVLPLFEQTYTIAILAGIAISNATSPLGLIDILAGVCAEGLAYLVCNTLANKFPMWSKLAITAVSVATIIGCEIAYIYNAPFFATALGLFATTIAAECIGYWMFAKTYLQKVFLCKKE